MKDKEYSVSVIFTGDSSGIKKAAADINKSLDNVNSSAKSIGTSVRNSIAKTGAALYVIKEVVQFVKKAIDLAKESGDLGGVGPDTVVQLGNIKTAWTEIKTSIGESILESKVFHKWITNIANRLDDIAERGLLRSIFESREDWEARQADKRKWDVDMWGNPIDYNDDSLPAVVTVKGLKSVQDYVNKIKAAAVEAAKMAEAWKIVHAELLGVTGEITKIEVKTPKVSYGWGDLPGLAGPPKYIEETTGSLERQMDTVASLTYAFGDMFMSIDEGFKGMVDSIIQSLKRLVAEIMAKAAVYALLAIVTGGTSTIFQSLGGFGNFVFGQGFDTGRNFRPKLNSLNGIGGQNISLNVNGKIAGRDILMSVVRSADLVYKNT